MSTNAATQKSIQLRVEREQHYYCNPKLCLFCKNPLPYKDHKRKIYCSKRCAVIVNNQTRSIKRSCLFCQAPIKTGIYCTHRCHRQHEYQQRIKLWQTDPITGSNSNGELSKVIRRYIFDSRENTCEKCGWSQMHPITRKYPLQIHHIDGDYSNNAESNLELLCPNCHSLTESYGGLNKGSGRKHRYSSH